MSQEQGVDAYLKFGLSLADVRRDGLLVVGINDDLAIVVMVGEVPRPGVEPAFTNFMRKIDSIVLNAGAKKATIVSLTQKEFEVALSVMFPLV